MATMRDPGKASDLGMVILMVQTVIDRGGKPTKVVMHPDTLKKLAGEVKHFHEDREFTSILGIPIEVDDTTDPNIVYCTK